MKKILIKYLSIYLSIFILLTQLCVQKVYAYTNDQIVTKSPVEGYTPPENFDYIILQNWNFYIQDSTGVPSNCYYFKTGNDKFGAVPEGQLVTLISNRGLGLAIEPTKMLQFIQAYNNTSRGLAASKLYDGSGNLLGTVLDDISGCHYEDAPNNTSFQIPKEEINNVYNYYQYYISSIVPDYVNIGTVSKSFLYRYIDVTTTAGQNIYNAINNNNFYLGQSLVQSSNDYYVSLGESVLSDASFYTNTQGMNTLCTYYGLTLQDNAITANEILARGYQSRQTSATLYARDSNNNVVHSNYWNGSVPTESTSESFSYNCSTRYNGGNVNSCAFTNDGKSITIYKDSSIYSQVFNHVYTPSYYITNKTQNFNTDNTQNITTTVQQTNNSYNSNETIYNEASDSYSETVYNEDNSSYYVDNSQIITNNTTIINNYYGDNSGGDSGGGDSGGGSESGDSPIWDALLAGIVNLLKKIGEIIAAILTGIIEICGKVLEAIASITETFTGVTDFFGAVIGFLPQEIVTVITLGVTLMILITLIHAFFK